MSYFRPEIEALAGYTPGEQPQTGKHIKLNTNENPYPASTAVKKAIAEALSAGLARYPDATADAFRHRAAAVLNVPHDWILCGNGSDDLLTILTRAFVGQGDLLRLPYPSYILYKTLAQIQGARSEEIFFDKQWQLGDTFTSAAEGLKLAFLPNPNSPSGTILSPSEVLHLAEKMPCPLVVDEAYVDFADENCISLINDCEKILVTRSLSKSYALAGLRFGFVVAQPSMIAQLIKVKDSYNCDALSIAAAIAAIDDQPWLAENREKIIATRQRATQQMRQFGFDVIDSSANFIWCTHAELSLKPIYQSLKQRKILIRYMNYTDWGEGLRISIGTDEQNDALMSILKTLL